MIKVYENVIAEFSQSYQSDVYAEGRAAAAYLCQLEAERLAERMIMVRWRERVQRIPWLGTWAVKLGRVMMNRLSH